MPSSSRQRRRRGGSAAVRRWSIDRSGLPGTGLWTTRQRPSSPAAGSTERTFGHQLGSLAGSATKAKTSSGGRAMTIERSIAIGPARAATAATFVPGQPARGGQGLGLGPLAAPPRLVEAVLGGAQLAAAVGERGLGLRERAAGRLDLALGGRLGLLPLRSLAGGAVRFSGLASALGVGLAFAFAFAAAVLRAGPTAAASPASPPRNHPRRASRTTRPSVTSARTSGSTSAASSVSRTLSGCEGAARTRRSIAARACCRLAQRGRVHLRQQLLLGLLEQPHGLGEVARSVRVGAHGHVEGPCGACRLGELLERVGLVALAGGAQLLGPLVALGDELLQQTRVEVHRQDDER